MYSTVLKHGDDVILDAMMKLFREADLHEEKVRLMRCMGAVSQPELIKKVLDFSTSVSFIWFTMFILNFSLNTVGDCAQWISVAFGDGVLEGVLSGKSTPTGFTTGQEMVSKKFFQKYIKH